MNRFFRLLCFFFLINVTLQGQAVSNLDCIGATPVCMDVFNEDIVPTNNGAFPNEINPSINCGSAGEILAIWYIFTVNQSGDFGFVITPANSGVDYDWTLFNLTNASCADIFNDGSLVVSCNAAGLPRCEGRTGATGESPFNIQGGGCDVNPPTIDSALNPFNDLIPVITGNTYVLYVSNWSQEPGGYEIDFSLSDDIGIFDQVNPTVADLPADTPCMVSEFPIQFSENIQCSTIGVSNFQIPGIPSSNYRLVSEVCNQGGSFDNEFILEVDPPISATGDYNIQITANNLEPILDLCDNSLLTRALSFRVDNDMPGPTLEDVIPDDNCQINEVTISFSQDLVCSGLNSNSFTVVSPNGTRLEGETILTGCELSSEFVYRFDEPIVDNGEYEVFLNSGQGIMFVNECRRPIDGTTSTFFTKAAEDEVSVGNINITGDCSVSDIVVPFTRPIQCNSIANENVQIEFMGTVLPGIISDTDCADRGSLMLLNEVTYTLDEPVSESGTYQVNIIGNGVDELLTDCGSVAMSSSQPFTIDLDIQPTTITSVSFPDDCNIQTLRIEFSTPVTCDNTISSGFSLNYNQEDIPITGITNCDSQNASTTADLNFGRALNEDGDYIISLANPTLGFSDVCNTSPEPFSLTGNLTFGDCDSCFVYIPTAFSPNDDGINEEVGPLSNCVFSAVEFNVFDRWGSLVYTNNGIDPTNMWNGFMADGELNPGVYAYVMELQLTEFRTPTTRTRRGTFTVLK